MCALDNPIFHGIFLDVAASLDKKGRKKLVTIFTKSNAAFLARAGNVITAYKFNLELKKVIESSLSGKDALAHLVCMDWVVIEHDVQGSGVDV